jgi:hypothetical protein
MQAKSLPSIRGVAWLQEGFLLWRRNPALLTFLTFGYLLLLLVLSLIPVLGQVVAALVMPVLSLGVLSGCRAVAEGRKVGPDILFSGFRNNLQALVTIGGSYFIASLAILGITMLVDGGVLLKIMTGAAQVDESTAAEPRLTAALLLALALSTPVMMAYWFAPVLAGWKGLSGPKAMFFSFIACVRNWRPFLTYSVALMVFGAIVPGVLIGLLSQVSPVLGSLLSIPLPLVLLPVLFASFYANARDVFGDFHDVPDDAQG